VPTPASPLSALRLRLRKVPPVYPVVVVGWPADGPGGPDVARIAAILMAGSADGRLPARPVLDRVLAEHGPALKRAFAQASAAYLEGDARKARGVLEGLARRLGDAVRNALGVGVTPGNAPSTIADKGYDWALRHPEGTDRLWAYLVAEVRPPT